MPRSVPLAFLAAVLACGGHPRQPAPEPARGPATAAALPPAPTEQPSVPPSLAEAMLLPPAPVMDTVVPAEELAAELRLAADSVADEKVLEELEDAAPADDDSADEAAPTPVTWDIDVDTYTSHDRVQYYLDFFQGKGRERMGTWLMRMPRYEGMIRTELARQNLPGDLVYLALIESGFSNSATSRAKAVGMWQFMKRTARGYGLRVDSWVDERRDPYRATIAAAKHLRGLDDRFGSVYMAAAAYNAGAGKVSRGIRRLPDDDDADSLNSDATFFRLYDTKLLRRETKDYVPKLIAAARIAKEPARYGFRIDSVEPSSYDSIVVPTMTGLDVIARLADTTVAAIREMNPQYLRLATPPGVPSVVRIPAGRGPATLAAYADLPPSRRITFIEHTVARGETMSGIAHRYRVNLSLVVQANPKLRGRMLRPGLRVIVPTSGAISASVARRMADPVEPASSSLSGFHRVRRGETLMVVGEEYGVTVSQLRAWNGLDPSEGIRAGQRIRVAPPAGKRSAPRTESTVRVATSGSNPPTTSAPSTSARTHTVRRGETLISLARRFGVSVQALRDANGLSGRDNLRAGATIKIPG
ncbi:MAG TPA: LysM peptidoglycan-binding domain-containing protein [Gemmatimonadales bacterium]|nr:LysM peptidoglycan-binding domain-containing protein [Gemmatimonadales bacterium]